ncbi:MAG TPA: response regulator [Phycisphaerae bacterium]|jgi:DNA-binding response OmpR family regulator
MPHSVLLIDDDARLVFALRTRLKALGYQVHTASSGEDGLVAARENPPNVILLDISMPRMDGYQFCRFVRADSKLNTTPIVVISAIDNESSRRAVFEAGANRFLPKPYELGQVVEAIRTACDFHCSSDLRAAGSVPLKSASERVL